MNELPYPSDLTAAQWALIERLLPAPKPKGRKRRVDLREITNAILYVLKGGISWRMLPREFAPWKTVYHYFRLWRLAGLWDRIHDQLRDQVRVSKGRHICPSAAIVDSQSVATQQKGAIGATMLRSAPRVVSGISWSSIGLDPGRSGHRRQCAGPRWRPVGAQRVEGPLSTAGAGVGGWSIRWSTCGMGGEDG